MHLVELFLPLADNNGVRFASEIYDSVERELTERFGGVTAYPRAPAHGLWKSSDMTKREDDILIYEVMTSRLDHEWWQQYRSNLEYTFRQEKLIVRAHEISML